MWDENLPHYLWHYRAFKIVTSDKIHLSDTVDQLSTRFTRFTHGERSEEFSRRWWDQAVYCCETASPWNAFKVCFYYTYIPMCDRAMVHNTLAYNRYLLRLMSRSKSDKAQSRLLLLRQHDENYLSLSPSLFVFHCNPSVHTIRQLDVNHKTINFQII